LIETCGKCGGSGKIGLLENKSKIPKIVVCPKCKGKGHENNSPFKNTLPNEKQQHLNGRSRRFHAIDYMGD